MALSFHQTAAQLSDIQNDIDIGRLTAKSEHWKQTQAAQFQQTSPSKVAKDLQKDYKLEIQRLKNNMKADLYDSNNELKRLEVRNIPVQFPSARPSTVSNSLNIGIPLLDQQQKQEQRTRAGTSFAEKNKAVTEMEKMVYDRKFKNFINHKDEILAHTQQQHKRKTRNLARQAEGAAAQEEDEFYVEDDILSNDDEDFQYRDSSQMRDAYQQIFNGQKSKRRMQLKHAHKYEHEYRIAEFQTIAQSNDADVTVTKEQVLAHLFDHPHIMLMYTIHPFTLGDELTDFATQTAGVMTFEEFSRFLLLDREQNRGYLDYTPETLLKARQLGKGIKCAPIIAEWRDSSQALDCMLNVFRSVDMFGNSKAQRAVLAAKMKKQAFDKQHYDKDVILVVNINKRIPLHRLIYEIEYEDNPQRQEWTLQDFTEFLQHYHRLRTTDKDKVIQKGILAGKFDVSYIFILPQSAINIIKDVFAHLQKFAEYFVSKEAFLDAIIAHSNYEKIKGFKTRKEQYKDLPIETVDQTLVRMYYEADDYLDVEEVLDFFTNRGRPKAVQHMLHLKNQELQLLKVEYEIALKKQKKQQQRANNKDQNTDQNQGETSSTTSSDEDAYDPVFNEQVRQRKVSRLHQKLNVKRRNEKADPTKQYNITIPIPFEFDSRDKSKKLSIREQKLILMLQEKRMREELELMPIPPKQVPWYVKENLYEKLMNQQERVRKIRLDQFRAELLRKMVPVPERLTRPIDKQKLHCTQPAEGYKFVARPMPWYCEVELLERINQSKNARRERILEQIINRHTEMDLPQGVKNMLERHEQLVAKRAEKTQQAFDQYAPDYNFQPKITHGLPEFYEQIKAELQENKHKKKQQKKQPKSPQPRDRQAYKHILQQEPAVRPASTLKHEALVKCRKQQQEQKLQDQQKLQDDEQMRQLRKKKFLPYFKKAIKQANLAIEDAKVHNEIVQREKLRQFQQNERQMAAQYQAQMLRTYAKVFQRPLLCQNGGQFGENEVSRVAKLNCQQDQYHSNQQQGSSKKKQQQQSASPKKQPQQQYHQHPPNKGQVGVDRQVGGGAGKRNQQADQRYGHDDQEDFEHYENQKRNIAEYERIRGAQENPHGQYYEEEDDQGESQEYARNSF